MAARYHAALAGGGARHGAAAGAARAGKPGPLVAFVDFFVENMVLVKTSCDQWTPQNLSDSGIDNFEDDGAFMTGLFYLTP